jgi:NAD(P)-dependent dehydrogenase (short-subunit alcohol dehydrogenase family)
MKPMETNLSEKTYVVTGATSGIGLAAAEILVRRGAAVIGVGRSSERCRQVEQQLRAVQPGAQVDYVIADLSIQEQVSRLSVEIHALLAARGKNALDGLVNNAGTFRYWLTLTPDGVETQWAVNHLAPFLLTAQLLDLLQASPQARVVTVSSDSHYGSRINWQDPQLRRRYNGLRAYGITKLANVLFTLELNRRLGAHSAVRAFAADPGLVKTDIGFKSTPALVNWIWKLRRSGGISPQASAEGIVYLLTEPSIQDSDALYWKHGTPKPASRQGLDPQTAAQLWALSEQMCGIQG